MFHKIKTLLRRVLSIRVRGKFGSMGSNTNISSAKLRYYACPSHIFLGNYVSIGRDCWFYASEQSKITIGDGTILAPEVKIYAHDHHFDGENLKAVPYDELQIADDVTIGEGSWIGTHVIILPGVTIGRGAVIGAGSVVTRDIPNYGIAVGNPARPVKFRNKDRFERLAADKKWARTTAKTKKVYIKQKGRII